MKLLKKVLKRLPKIRKTWEVIKDSISKGKCNNQNFLKKVIVDNIVITDETQIAETFFTENVPERAETLKHRQQNDDYLEQYDTMQPDNLVFINQRKKHFFPSDK